MRPRAALAGLVLLLALAPAPASAQAPYPPRRDFVADGTGSVGADDSGRLSEDYAARIGERYALEGILIAVDDCRPAPDPYFDGALVHYGLAPRPGELVDDALAFFVCADLGYAGFSYAVGNAYARFLDPLRVERAMVGFVAEGDVQAAVEAGIEVVVADLRDAPLGRGGYAPVVAAAATRPPEEAEPGGDGARRAGGGGLLLAALAMLGLWSWSRARDRRTDPEAGGAAPEPVTVAKVAERVAALEGRLASDSPLLGELMSRCEPLGDTLLLELDRRHQAQVARFQELRRRLEARAKAPTALATEDGGIGEARRLEALLGEAEGLHAYVEQLELESRHAQDLSENAAEHIAEASGVLLASHAAYGRARASLGARPELALPEADRAMALPERLWGAAEPRVDEAPLAAARQAEDAADLARRIARAATALRAADRRVAAAARGFGDLAGLSPERWREVRGDGTEADASLARAVAMLRALIESPVDGLGADPALVAALQLGRVAEEIERARGLAIGLLARSAHLRHTLSSARGELTRMVEDLTRIEREGAPGGPSATTAEALSQARALMTRAEAALADTAPDPIAARALLRRAEEALDGVPGHDHHLARRRRLRAVRRDAEAAVQRATGYHARHRTDIGRRATARLAGARDAWRAARRSLARTRSGAEDLRAWARVGPIAEDALAIALADAERADARRVAWAPRSSWAGPVAPPTAPPRRAPFPGRFGDWGVARDPGLPPRRGRWGGRPPEDDGAEPSADGVAPPRLATPGW